MDVVGNHIDHCRCVFSNCDRSHHRTIVIGSRRIVEHGDCQCFGCFVAIAVLHTYRKALAQQRIVNAINAVAIQRIIVRVVFKIVFQRVAVAVIARTVRRDSQRAIVAINCDRSAYGCRSYIDPIAILVLDFKHSQRIVAGGDREIAGRGFIGRRLVRTFRFTGARRQSLFPNGQIFVTQRRR